MSVTLGLAALVAATGFATTGFATTAFATPAAARPAPSWKTFDTGVDARIRGLAAVSRWVAWVGNSAGGVLRTLDGGRTWQQVGPPGTSDLQFRDIEAFDERHAVVLAAGEGDLSRVYRTDDGGRTWTETFRNDEPRAFYDCMAFLDRWHGLALSDPVDGRFRILSTSDGGRSWRVLPTTGMPPALDGEFAFAASGTCLVTAARDDRSRDAWFATGGGSASRVFHSTDGGRTWSVVTTPVPSGPTAGIYSLAFRDRHHGLAVGGDFTTPTQAPNGAALTRDGGRTWTVARTVPGEYRSGVAWRTGDSAIAVGPTGSDLSRDGGRTWTRFDTGSFDAVACAGPRACWASGEHGRVAILT